jgi:GntR family transcriptional repressor for pyruvate dehydrogenase complex
VASLTGKTTRGVELPPLDPPQQVRRETLLELLDDLIVSGAWPAGSKLPSERALCQHFGLSRPVVREVLRRLEERGLIDVQPARGSFVRRLSAVDATRSLDALYRRTGATARDLVVARTMLECEAAALAATNATAKAQDRMQMVLAAHDATRELDHRAELDVSFHESIARASGNPVLHIMFASIRPLVSSLVMRSLADREVREAGEPLHRTILDAIVSRDAESARSAMHEHLALALTLYGDDLDRPLQEIAAERTARTAQVAEITHRLAELDDSPA